MGETDTKTKIPLKQAILQACRADMIPEGAKGNWSVVKMSFDKYTMAKRGDKLVLIDPGSYTYLQRSHEEISGGYPLGECVMHDTYDELVTHLDFMLHAFGRVLITGLGLGCVARGCLANPAVKSVTVIEKDKDVIDLVWKYMSTGNPRRLRLIHMDALEFTARKGIKFDCAWHDLWTDTKNGEPHLQMWHSNLIVNCSKKVRMQGAWEFPHEIKRAWNRLNVPKGAAVVI